jgi:hypothetical protein
VQGGLLHEACGSLLKNFFRHRRKQIKESKLTS